MNAQPSQGDRSAYSQVCSRVPALIPSPRGLPSGEKGRVPGRHEEWAQLQSWSEHLLISRLHGEAETARALEMVSMTTAATHSPSRM